MQTVGTNQHYVPQFVLRGFASRGRNKQLYVFDKATETTDKVSVGKAAAEIGFYDAVVDGETRSLDPLFSELERLAGATIGKIRHTRSLKGISEEEKQVIALFVTAQLLRTKAHRAQFKAMNDTFRDAIIERGGDPYQVKNFKVLNEEEARIAHMQLIPELARDLVPHVVNKAWLLYETSSRHAFYISDNPVTLHNTINTDPFRGTLGLAVPGIEIYFPLNGTLSLGLLCRSIDAEIREGQIRADRIGAPLTFRPFIAALNGDAPLAMVPENVMHQNSLQVINAERYVFSSDGDFTLVREMLQSNPELKAGPRLTVA